MSTVRELHNRAMELAEQAFAERERGNMDAAIGLSRDAVPFEIQAAEQVPNTPESEPTRSILYRSAASLAFQAADYDLAERLVVDGLAGSPPPRLQNELLDLQRRIAMVRPATSAM